ncbi:MAG: MOSC N-terminal beta barrel domain-containing protein [Terriglobales bacterium]
MKVAEIWRYPVKSMGGEKLDRAMLDKLGIAGDRIVHVEDARGHVVTARTYSQLLGHHAKLNSRGEPTVDGTVWTDPQVMQQVIEIVGPGARLVHDESADRFDILPLLVATDGAIAAFGHDGRRLRPNIVIGDVKGLAERSWSGQRLRIADVIVGIEDLRSRCVMTTFDPDTLEQDRGILKDIVQRFGGKLALNCYVIQGGEIQVGDDVQLASHGKAEDIRASQT